MENSGQNEVFQEGKEGEQSPSKPFDSVTIIGMGPTCSFVPVALMKGLIPSDERNPIWVINAAAKAFPHQLAWNTHDLNQLHEKPAEKEIVPKLMKWYRDSYKRPVMTLRAVPELNTLVYPIKSVVEYWQDDYFFGAPSYMLAYAAMLGARHFRLYGLDFDYPTRTEYEAGRCAMEYWCGRVRTLGARFETPAETSLFDRCYADQGGRIGYGWPLYGYFDNQPPITRDSNGRMIVDDSGVK